MAANKLNMNSINEGGKIFKEIEVVVQQAVVALVIQQDSIGTQQQMTLLQLKRLGNV